MDIGDRANAWMSLMDSIKDSVQRYYFSEFSGRLSNGEVEAEFELLCRFELSISDYRMSYKEYLKTFYWYIVSSYYKRFVRKRCVLCNSDKRVNVHHSSYSENGVNIKGTEHLSVGTIGDILTVLCEKCHCKYHGVKK